MLEKSNELKQTQISLWFTTEIQWDLVVLVDDVMKWLNDHQMSNTSKVGMLSSPQFLELAKAFVEEETIKNFQQMLYAQSLAYTQPTAPDKHQLSVLELQQIAAIAGHNCLNFLDARLNPQSLSPSSAHSSKDHYRVLFLLIIATILAVGYASPTATHPEFPREKVGVRSILSNRLIR